MAQLAIETLLAVDELPDGNVLVYPVVEPHHGAVGRLDNALTELRLFLAEELSAETSPRRIARFAAPADAEPLPIQVTIPEADLPKRLRKGVDVLMHAVRIPHGGAHWVLIPALRHTVYVGKNDELEETVRHEVHRHLNALSPQTWDRIGLLPPVDHRIERVSVMLDRPDPQKGSTRKLKRDLAKAQDRKRAAEILSSIAIPLHTDPAVLHGPPIVGRREEIDGLDALIGGETRTSVLLVGPQRVGKSAVLHAWLRNHEDRRVYQTSGAQLIAGMSGLGQWQERMRRVLSAAETLDAILYFDDLRDLFDRTSGRGNVDLPGAMKTALEEQRVRVLGELDEESADLLASQQEGFFQSFHTLRIPATDRAHATEVLAARAERIERPEVRVDARDAMLALSERYLPYRPFPGKAAELFDQVLATVERPGVFLDEEERVRASDVYRLFSLQTGIPEFLLREDRPLDPDRLRARFAARLVGQVDAVDAVVDTLCVVKAGLQPADKPLATFLFVGPTGVGKTELARALAEVLYGSEERLVRFDMSEYSDGRAVERLIRGTGGMDGLLTRQVREQPFAVILLDEIEKAHPAVFDLLLQVTGEGRLSDARGRTAFFHNAILIMTSNIGATHRLRGAGFESEGSTSDRGSHYTRAVQRWFRPEFVNRLDRIIPFGSLTREDIETVTGMMIASIAQRRGLADRGIGLEVSEAARNQLAEGGFDEAYGARALRRHLEDKLVAPIATAVAALAERAKDTGVRVQTIAEAGSSEPLAREERDGLRFEVLPGAEGVGAEIYKALNEVATLRRMSDDLMSLPSVEIHREEMRSLLAQLAAPRSKKVQQRRGVELAQMQKDLHTLETRWKSMSDAREEIIDLEELVFLAFFDRETYPSALEDVKALQHRFRMELLELLLDADRRDSITILCEELDQGRTLDVWLRTLLLDLERRKWRARCHVYRDPTPQPGKPAALGNWGAVRDPESMIEYLDRPDRERAVVLVRLDGRHVGTLISIECGLHRHFGVEPLVDGSHHRVTRVAMRSELRDPDWEHPILVPSRPPSVDKALRMTVVRYTDVRPNRKINETYVDVPLEDYWVPENSDELALRDLITIERNPSRERSQLYTSPLDVKPDAEDAEDEDGD